jgi:hypothetical protein
MKPTLSLLIALTILVLVGCTENQDTVSTNQASEISQPNFLTFPMPKGLSVEKRFNKSERIENDHGGKVKIKEEYQSEYGKVKIEAELKLEKHSLALNELDVSMNLDLAAGTVTFHPSTILLEPAKFKLKIEGIDLTGVDENNIKFVFWGPYGVIEPVEFDKIKIKYDEDIEKNKLELKDGYICNFTFPEDPSRFGFVK